jgi:hypothetical protein
MKRLIRRNWRPLGHRCFRSIIAQFVLPSFNQQESSFAPLRKHFFDGIGQFKKNSPGAYLV